MHNTVQDLRPFLPAKDFGRSKQFYTDLGFTLNFGSPDIAEFQIGSYRFLLQNYYNQVWAENFMMSLMVHDADAWWTHIQATGLTEKYPGTTAQPPKLQPWGLRVLYLTDPSSVLWHITDDKKKA